MNYYFHRNGLRVFHVSSQWQERGSVMRTVGQHWPKLATQDVSKFTKTGKQVCNSHCNIRVNEPIVTKRFKQFYEEESFFQTLFLSLINRYLQTSCLEHNVRQTMTIRSYSRYLFFTCSSRKTTIHYQSTGIRNKQFRAPLTSNSDLTLK